MSISPQETQVHWPNTTEAAIRLFLEVAIRLFLVVLLLTAIGCTTSSTRSYSSRTMGMNGNRPVYVNGQRTMPIRPMTNQPMMSQPMMQSVPAGYPAGQVGNVGVPQTRYPAGPSRHYVSGNRGGNDLVATLFPTLAKDPQLDYNLQQQRQLQQSRKYAIQQNSQKEKQLQQEAWQRQIARQQASRKINQLEQQQQQQIISRLPSQVAMRSRMSANSALAYQGTPYQGAPYQGAPYSDLPQQNALAYQSPQNQSIVSANHLVPNNGSPNSQSDIRMVSGETVDAQTVGSVASPELSQPWDFDELQRRQASRRVTTYRLVSETQSNGNNNNANNNANNSATQSEAVRRMPPPAMNPNLMFAPTPAGSTPSNVNPSGAGPLPTRNFPYPPQGRHRQSSLPPNNVQETSGKPSPGFPIFNVGQELANEFRPRNDRTWSPNHAVLSTAEFNGKSVTVRNIRYTKYEPDGSYTPRYYDAVFDLDDIRTIDLIVVPFQGLPSLAHVEASFGFSDGRQLGMSIEARYEKGEKYDPVGAGLRQFELIYVLADERDLIRLGTEVSKNDVHLYRLKFEPGEVRTMFIDAMNRVNQLAATPEFYHPLRNSCVTNLMSHINKGRPRAIPSEYRTLLPGLMDHYVYDLKLVDTSAKSFTEAKLNAKVNWLTEKYGDLEYFSAGIRQNMY